MSEKPFTRRLSAILSADVKGYSRLMREDEEATVRTITAYRTAITHLIQQYRGRVVDSPGDNILAEFSSVVDAVNCAVEIQRDLAERNSDLPENRRMLFRIGINLGDVLEEGERIYGDGVNVAARMESLSEAGGICTSGTVYDAIESKIGLEYEFLGEQQVKNISKPVRAYRVRLQTASAGREKETGPALPHRPSIAVLPFVNMSIDPAQEYLADGISENIITALSHVSELFVIARNSSFIYKGRPVKVQEVGRELGVRYILEGSLQKAGERVRVNAQLVDAATGHHLWADRYDRNLEDIFALQDEITREIVVALQVRLTEGEQARLRHRSTQSLEAWGYAVEAIGYFNQFSRSGNIKARELAQKAIEIEPDNAMLMMLLAWTYLMDAAFGAEKLRSHSFSRAVELADQASSMDDSLAEINSLQSYIQVFLRNYDRAVAEGAKGVELAPNSANNRAVYAHTLLYTGDFKGAIAEMERAMRLSPYYPDYYLINLAWAHFMIENYQAAAEVWERHLQLVESRGLSKRRLIIGHIGLAACFAALGKEESGRKHAQEVLSINPQFTLENIRRLCPYKDADHLERLLAALRRSGLA